MAVAAAVGAVEIEIKSCFEKGNNLAESRQIKSSGVLVEENSNE